MADIEDFSGTVSKAPRFDPPIKEKTFFYSKRNKMDQIKQMKSTPIRKDKINNIIYVYSYS